MKKVWPFIFSFFFHVLHFLLFFPSSPSSLLFPCPFPSLTSHPFELSSSSLLLLLLLLLHLFSSRVSLRCVFTLRISLFFPSLSSHPLMSPPNRTALFSDGVYYCDWRVWVTDCEDSSFFFNALSFMAAVHAFGVLAHLGCFVYRVSSRSPIFSPPRGLSHFGIPRIWEKKKQTSGLGCSEVIGEMSSP